MFELISINQKTWGGGYVDGIKPGYASTRTASGASGEADTSPHRSGERGGERETKRGGSPLELMPAMSGSWAKPEG